MARDTKKQNNEADYEEVVKKKLDKIIEQTSVENSALKKILESLNNDTNDDKKKNNKEE